MMKTYRCTKYLPRQCRLCHMEIYEQWQGSMHAKSTALSDPIHRAFYKKVIGDPTKEGVNCLVYHRFRNMSLRITAYNIEGKLLWTNYKKHPSKEDPKAYFVMRLKDKDGHFTSPPKATSLGPDNRMKPYEKRKLNYEFPAQGVSLVRVELYYNLLWPSLNKKMKFLPNHLKEAKRIAFAESRINNQLQLAK
ncbi:MAG: multiheme c-type cytochrome [Pseudomonadota bacterium]